MIFVYFNFDHIIWTPSSEFVSSSIPSWQTLTAHAQPFRGARDLAFCLKVPLDSPLVWASSEGSGETARMRRLAWTFAARIGYKYQIRLTRSIWHIITFCPGMFVVVMSTFVKSWYLLNINSAISKPSSFVVRHGFLWQRSPINCNLCCRLYYCFNAYSQQFCMTMCSLFWRLLLFCTELCSSVL